MDSSSDAMMCTFDSVFRNGRSQWVNSPSVKRTSRSLENRTVSDAAPKLRILPSVSYDEAQNRTIHRTGSTDQTEEPKKGKRRGGMKRSTKEDSSADTAYIVLLAV